MKTLIKVSDHAWLDPSSISALVDNLKGTVVVLDSGESITVYGITPDELLDTIADALAPTEEPE